MSVKLYGAAPNFTAQANGGRTISLADFRGSNIVLYFYPKDNTPGCTAEACDFRDNMARIISKGAIVIGISPDSIDSHEKFLQKYDLNFTIVSDVDAKICQLYGVWMEKSMYGRKYMGVARTTFLIDEQGIIQHIWENVKVKGHIEEVISTLQSKI